MIQYVIYRRVSTKEQGKSRLGLDAQIRDIQTYLENYSGQPYEILGEFLDILSGADDSRPELEKAIAQAKKTKSILLVAKLDRLSRKVSFIAKLTDDKKLQFKVASLPNADKTMLHIYAVLAEQERDFISQRTKAALREAKARGVKLGGLREGTLERAQAKRDEALKRAKRIEEIVIPLRNQGASLQSIANALNKTNEKTLYGGDWMPMQVSRVISRLKTSDT
jgi:DNA invertase Pin-like site-specific DNA recombinase